MEIFSKRLVAVGLVLLYCFSIQMITCFKPDHKKGGITQDKIKDHSNYRKDCVVKEKCRECTFDELKNIDECKFTGYKTLKHCSLFDEMKLVDEYYTTEECSENKKINSVLTFFLICLIIGILSFYIRKSHKSFILNQTLEKLTILRKHN